MYIIYCSDLFNEFISGNNNSSTYPLVPCHIMSFSKQTPLLLLLLIFPLLNASHPNPCYNSTCGRGKIDVRFPFWLSSKQPESCGDTGFKLVCTDRNETALELPNSKPFLVQGIDYRRQRIRLSDPDSCLARQLLSFDASGSPFSLFLPRSYSVLICPKDEKVSPSFRSIHCLGNSTSSFFVTESEQVSLMPSSCHVFKTLHLPFSFHGDINYQDLWLKWDTPDCRYCERSGSSCGFINNTTRQVQCLSSVNSGTNPLMVENFKPKELFI